MWTPSSCSAVLCVLDEAEIIEDSLESLLNLGLKEVIVVDGGSTDGTLSILKTKKKIRVLSLPNQGLLRQRIAGIASAKSAFVLLVDADDKIEVKELEENLAILKKEPSLDGVQFRLRSPNRNFWERGWTTYFGILTRPGESIKLLGRPSIAKTTNFANLPDAPVNIFGEDTWIHFQEKGLGRKYKTGPGFSTRSCPSDIFSNFRQFKRYGKTDCELATTPGEHFNLLFHAGIRIAFFRSWRALFQGSLSGFVFTFLLGQTRAVQHYKQWLFGE